MFVILFTQSVLQAREVGTTVNMISDATLLVATSLAKELQANRSKLVSQKCRSTF